MTFWTPDNLQRVTAGDWLRRPGSSAPIQGLSTDSREIAPGQVFLAIRGGRFDGHEYLGQAAQSGSPLLIVDEEARGNAVNGSDAGPGVLKVADTRRALLALGAAYRQTLRATKVIAVLGANGKTTTTRLIDAALRTTLRGTSSPRSFNNDIGVPWTILTARPDDEYLLCEVGTNHPGEIALLAPVVRPDVVVITSVGRAHVEHFGTVEATVKEDASIFACLQPDGLAVVPADDATIDSCVRGLKHVVRFGRGGLAEFRVTHAEHVFDGQPAATDAKLRFTINSRDTFELPLIGEHNALNGAAAIAVACHLGVPDEAIRRGLASASPADMRLNRREVRGVNFVIDCYNANPESTAAAVRTFASLSTRAVRRVIVLGDMLELGDHAPGAHREIGQIVAKEARPDLFITFGAQAALAAEEAASALGSDRVRRLEASEEGIGSASDLLRPGDAVLLKGSRGMRLERIVRAFESLPATA